MRLAPLLVLYVVVGLLAQPGAEPVRDEPALLAAAERLLHHGQLAGTGTDTDQRAFLWHGPGLVVLLVPLVALDVPLAAMRLTSPLLLFVAVALFHRLLRMRLDRRAALAWTYALGLYAPFAIVLGTIQKEPLAIALVVAAMLACTHAFPADRRVAMPGAGLALAALAMVRPEYGGVVPALLAVAALSLLRRRVPARIARGRVWVAAVAALACVPWLAFTHERTGQVLYWSASSGLSLFWMSPTLPGETGQWHSPVRVFRDPALAPYRPLFARLDEVHPLASDLELRRRAVENIRAQPLRYARNLAANAARLVVFSPTRPGQQPGEIAVLALANGALLAGLAWAARQLWRRRRSALPETAPFALFVLLGVLIHVPPSASPRMLMPLVPVLVWLVARGWAEARAVGDTEARFATTRSARQPLATAAMRLASYAWLRSRSRYG